MYQNRHPGSSHNQVRDRIPEYLDGLREEYNALRQQLQKAHAELEKHVPERDGLQRQIISYYEQTCTMGAEIAKNMEIIKRLVTIIQHSIQHLPPEQQEPILQSVNRARNITPQEMIGLMQQSQMSMMPGMGPMAAGGMMPGFNPFLAAAAAANNMTLKPEELNALAAQFAMNPKMPMLPMANPLSAAMAAATASTSQAQTPHANNSSHSTNAGGSHALDGTNNSRAASTTSRPRSGTGTPMSKRPRHDLDETDNELEIDVQNDDTGSFAQPSATHTNGTHKNASHKNGRESAQSISSRDSSATPKSSKQNANNLTAMAFMPPQLNSLFGLDPAASRLMFPNASLGNHTNGEPPYAYKIVDGGAPQPVQFPSDALEGSDIPKNLTKVSELHHGEVVCAVTMSPTDSRVYTGGQGVIKVWDINNPTATVHTALQTIDCNIDKNYVRSCKLLPDNKTLLVGGEAECVVVIDLETSTVIQKLECGVQACYALAISPDGRHCYSCCADGNIIVWDLTTFKPVDKMMGHEDGASCVDLSADGKTLWTGGLDKVVCSWDVAERQKKDRFVLDSQVFSLGCSPTDDMVAVGMESSHVELLDCKRNEKYVLHQHENCVLSLRFAHSGNWFVSTGKDSTLVTWRPQVGGARLVKTKEGTSVLSCDISADDKYIVSGSGEKRATVYEVSY
ncbi:Transcription factor unc-37 [Aphelenchoides besseyi]|nr:Transcription factor unc-37 [Aphelenchoides besseyi]